jgi:thiosulfate/3-mercaptopyruvate sulfurtransferase
MDRLVNGAWLEKELGAPDLRVLHCTIASEVLPEGGVRYRSGDELWARKHIPGSAHVDFYALSDSSSPLPFMVPPPHQFSAVMGELGVGDGTRVVLYDAFMNVWAARVWWMLRAFGFDDAAILDGGWRAWTAEGHPISTDPAPDHAPANFVARVRPDLFVGKDEVLAAIENPDVSIVHALSREVHRGERQDYARPGHIPGAHNVPFAELVERDTHRYLPQDRLSAAFSGVPSGRVITYCGGGVAASSDAFVLGLLGVEDVAVYDGSLYEWAAEAALPLVLGD